MTLYKLVQNLIAISESFPNISFVHSGDVYELNKRGDIDYPAIVISQSNHFDNTLFDNNTYGFNIFAIDRLTSDADNTLDVQSWADRLLRRMINIIEDNNIGIINEEVVIHPFTERFESLCAGCYAEVQIQIDNIDCEGDDYLVTMLDKINKLIIIKKKEDLDKIKVGDVVWYNP